MYPMSFRRTHRSFTTSRPRTWAVPASGSSNVTRMRKSVVLPAPSGPITPYSSPGPTSNDTSWSATVSPKCRVRPRASTASPSLMLRPAREYELTRHADAEPALRIGHRDFHGIHLIRALLARLDRSGRELGRRRDPGDSAGQRDDRVGPIHPDPHLLPETERGELGLGDVGAEGERVQRSELEERLARLHELARLDVAGEHRAGERAPDPAPGKPIV